MMHAMKRVIAIFISSVALAAFITLGTMGFALAEESNTWQPTDGTIVCFTPDNPMTVSSLDSLDTESLTGSSNAGIMSLGDPATTGTPGADGIQPQDTPTNLVPYPLTLYCMQSTARSMFSNVNYLRASVGANTLTWDSDLENTAMLRAAECAIYYSHTRPSGLDCFTAFPSSVSGTCGENIAANSYSYDKQIDVTFNGWLNSPGHYANMVNTDYKSIGIGCAALYYEERWFFFWVQDFAGSDGSGVTTSAVDGYQTWKLYVQDDTVTSMGIDPTTIYVGLNSTQETPTASLSFSGRGSMGYFNGIELLQFTPPPLSGTYTYSKGYLHWSVPTTDIAAYTSDGLIIGKKVGTETGTAAFTYSSKDTRQFTIKVHPWTRLAGATRVGTMGTIIDNGFTDGSCANGSVILTTAYNYADALSASGLAGALSCPIVTTEGATLSTTAADEIKRLGASKVYILGGTDAISNSVETSVKSLSGVTEVERLQGDGRIDTDLAIYRKGTSATTTGSNAWSDTCVVTKGYNYADALAIAPYAYAAKCPIFLSQADGTLSSDTIAAIKSGGFTHVIVLGGAASSGGIQDSTVTALGFTSNDILRLFGSDRMATSEAIANWATGNDRTAIFQPQVLLSYNGMAVANAWNYPDALSSVGLLGPKRGVLILVDTSDATQARINRLVGTAQGATAGFILDGTSAVSYTDETWIGSRYL